MPEKTERQTLIFSAAFSGEIQCLGGNFLNDYLFLMAGMVVSHQTFSIQSFFFLNNFILTFHLQSYNFTFIK